MKRKLSSVRTLISVFLLAFGFGLISQSASAQVTTYTYTGNAYNRFGGTFACPPVCGITGSFTVAAPLTPNANYYFTPLSFSFTDGLTTFTPANVTGSSFGVVTNSLGQIIGWNMGWLTAGDEMFSGTNPPGCVGCHVVDGSFDTPNFAEINNTPGRWSSPLVLVSIAVTPLTATIGLGQMQQFTATGMYSDGSMQNLTNTVTWTAPTVPTVGTISNVSGSQGLASAVADGTTTITATIGGVSGTGILTVAPPIGFVLTGNLITNRTLAAATLLNNGTVLIAGGSNNTAALASAEIYNPASGRFTATGNMTTARDRQPTATLLPNGKVLFTGGVDTNTQPLTVLASAELYDPTTETFTATGSMTTSRFVHTATLLPDGTVLIAGGVTFTPPSTFTSLVSAEIYNPATGTFTATGSMTFAGGGTAILLNNGKVLIAGGDNAGSADLYNPATRMFTATGSMTTVRFNALATLLNNGTVLVTGGVDIGTNSLASAELYNPVTEKFTATGSMTTTRVFDTATLLNNGMVLITGGYIYRGRSIFIAVPSTELYDPATGIFTPTGTMNFARDDHTATLLNNGMVLVAGGDNDDCSISLCSGDSLFSAELYQPALPPATSQSLTQPLSPTAPNQFQFDNNVHNFTAQYPAGTNFSGVNMTVTAQQISPASFQQRVAGTQFANALCIVYDGEQGYCEDYQVSCTDTSGNSIACPSEPSPSISVKTSYDTHETIINPGFLTTPLGTNNWSNIFDSFYLPRIDASTKGHTNGFSEFVAVSFGTTNPQGEGNFAFLAPLQQSDDRIFPPGIPIPVEFELLSLTQPGTPVTDATAGITVTMISDASGNPVTAIVLEKSSAFRYLNGRYVYFLNTENYAPGVYKLTVYGNAFPGQQVEFTLPESTSGVRLRTKLQSLTFDSSANQYVAVLNVTNSSRVEANGVVVILSALNVARTSTILPYSLGDISPGASTTVTLTYATAAGKEGSPALLVVIEAFAGGFAPAFIPTKLP